MPTKSRSFAFLIYPESWPSWRDDLESLHVPIVVSPLHDKDLTDDGSPKKPHFHAIISWGNSVALTAPLHLLEPFGVEHVEPLSSFSAYCRYLLHLDNPDKAQYQLSDVVCLSGGSPDFTKQLSAADRCELRTEILKSCRENGVCEYADLVEFAVDEKPAWLSDVYSATIFWRGYFASVRNRNCQHDE
jgi:hypothetical protein